MERGQHAAGSSIYLCRRGLQWIARQIGISRGQYSNWKRDLSGRAICSWNQYFPGGKYPLVEPLAAAKNAYMLLQCFGERGEPHVHIQHISLEPDATFFIKGDSGSDIHDSVAHFEGEPIVYKHEPNSFLNTNLLELLKSWDIERVVIAGMMTHMCVDATSRAAS